jgi:hypothetical protein
MNLIEHEVVSNEGTVAIKEIKCTHDAAASIALACAEIPYESAVLALERLSGIDINAMTEHRVTDSVGAEFVKEVPNIDEDSIAKMTGRFTGNIIENHIEELKNSDNMTEIIKNSIKNGAKGVLRKDYAGPAIKVMYIEIDGTGVPGRQKELAGVKGKQADGSAQTFEAKVGATFIVEHAADGRPLLTDDGEIYRDQNVKYTGTVSKVDEFGRMLYRHALDNGLEDVDVVVFLGDGAKWVWGIQEKYFPYALTGLDLYHSIEKIGLLADHLQFKGRAGTDKKTQFTDECINLLKHGNVMDMLSLIETQACKKGHEKRLQSTLGYFRSNMDRMDYGVFTALGLFVGSGVIEAGVKVIVAGRMKNAGMHWSKNHAEKMIALRCAIRNGGFFSSYLPDQTTFQKIAA